MASPAVGLNTRHCHNIEGERRESAARPLTRKAKNEDNEENTDTADFAITHDSGARAVGGR